MTFFQLHLPPGEIVLRFLMAAVFGGLLGWDREAANKPAGIRTFMLVSLGASAFMIFSFEIINVVEFSDAVEFDPTRVIQGIVGGIGFLGAGSIIQSAGSVKGMTTAATIWMAGAVGAICGAGLYGLALILTIFGIIVLAVLGRIIFKFKGFSDQKS